MKCPYCETTFPLTWGRYWGSPIARHRCPECNKVSRLPFTISYLLLLILAICAGGIPGAFLFYNWLGADWTIAGWAVGGFSTGFPIDKVWLDGRYRQLAKLKERHPPSGQ
jgi:hypothetical protein